MTDLWRISNYTNLTGHTSIGRWSSGRAHIVYLAESPAGAMLEILAHLPLNQQRFTNYTLLRISASEDLMIRQIDPTSVADWRKNLQATQKLGDAWLLGGESALARVPSAIMSHTWNLLLNPKHPEAERMQIAEVLVDAFDERLFRLHGKP